MVIFQIFYCFITCHKYIIPVTPDNFGSEQTSSIVSLIIKLFPNFESSSKGRHKNYDMFENDNIFNLWASL